MKNKIVNDMGKVDIDKLVKVLEELSQPVEIELPDFPAQISELKERLNKIESSLYGSIERLEKKIDKLDKPVKKSSKKE
jgi:archaellum component FlaC